MTKKELRLAVRAQKKLHSERQMAAMSEEICRKVLESACWQESQTLLLYYPLADEVDVRPLIFKAVEAGKRVLLPVCVGNELELYPYEGEASLMVGSYGIMSPKGRSFCRKGIQRLTWPLFRGWHTTEPGIDWVGEKAIMTVFCLSLAEHDCKVSASRSSFWTRFQPMLMTFLFTT